MQGRGFDHDRVHPIRLRPASEWPSSRRHGPGELRTAGRIETGSDRGNGVLRKFFQAGQRRWASFSSSGSLRPSTLTMTDVSRISTHRMPTSPLATRTLPDCPGVKVRLLI